MKRFWLLVFIALIILPASSVPQEQGVQNVSYTMSDCQGSFDSEEHYTNLAITDSMMSMDVMLYGNCGMLDSLSFELFQDTLFLNYDFPRVYIERWTEIDTIYSSPDTLSIEGELWIVDFLIPDSTVIESGISESGLQYSIVETTVISESYEMALCNCYFCFHLEFSGLDTSELVIHGKRDILPYYPEGRKIYPVTFEIIKGDTLNLSDRFGMKQGLWKTADNISLREDEIIYKNNEAVQSKKSHYRVDGTISHIVYQDQGSIKLRYVYYDSDGIEIIE